MKTKGAWLAGLPVKDLLTLAGGLAELEDRTRNHLELAGIGLDLVAGKGLSRFMKGLQLAQGSIHILTLKQEFSFAECPYTNALFSDSKPSSF